MGGGKQQTSEGEESTTEDRIEAIKMENSPQKASSSDNVSVKRKSSLTRIKQGMQSFSRDAQCIFSPFRKRSGRSVHLTLSLKILVCTIIIALQNVFCIRLYIHGVSQTIL